MSTISHARKRANQVSEMKVVARARNTGSQRELKLLLQFTPRSPAPNPQITKEKDERHSAAIHRP